MLKSERMSKLFVVGPKSKLESVISKLHELKVAHFIEHKKDEFDIIYSKSESIAMMLSKLSSSLKGWSINDKCGLKYLSINDKRSTINELFPCSSAGRARGCARGAKRPKLAAPRGNSRVEKRVNSGKAPQGSILSQAHRRLSSMDSPIHEGGKVQRLDTRCLKPEMAMAKV